MNAGSSQFDWLCYFVAHAPRKAPGWFHPVMPPKPVHNPKWKWCEPCWGDYGSCDGTRDCEKLRQYQRETAEWNDLQDREKVLQWPIYWAKEQIARIEKEAK